MKAAMADEDITIRYELGDRVMPVRAFVIVEYAVRRRATDGRRLAVYGARLMGAEGELRDLVEVWEDEVEPAIG